LTQFIANSKFYVFEKLKFPQKYLPGVAHGLVLLNKIFSKIYGLIYIICSNFRRKIRILNTPLDKLKKTLILCVWVADKGLRFLSVSNSKKECYPQI